MEATIERLDIGDTVSNFVEDMVYEAGLVYGAAEVNLAGFYIRDITDALREINAVLRHYLDDDLYTPVVGLQTREQILMRRIRDELKNWVDPEGYRMFIHSVQPTRGHERTWFHRNHATAEAIYAWAEDCAQRGAYWKRQAKFFHTLAATRN